MEVNMIIKKGEKFLCVSDVFMGGTNQHAYTQGKVYTSHRDGCITNNQGYDRRSWPDGAELFFDRHYQDEVFNPQPHYDNSKGSLYKVATDLNLNHWEFDIFKRLVRCRKKEQFKQDLQKIKDTIDIYIKEYDRDL